MKNKKNNRTQISEKEIWNDAKSRKIGEYILSESQKQSPERKIKNQLLAIQYRMEDYIENDHVQTEMQILDFIKLYLEVLNITQKKLAEAFGMQSPNLHKHLNGNRKLNPDIAFKLGSFSRTAPELWYSLQTKNELFRLKKEKGNIEKYDKYDYEKILVE